MSDTLNDGGCYKCGICQNFTSQSHAAWVVHLAKHKVVCPYCGKTFHRRDNLKIHIKHTHKGVLWTSPTLGSGISERLNLQNEHWTGELITKQETELNFYHYQYLIKLRNFTEKDNESVENKLKFINNVVCSIGDTCRQLMTHPADKIQLIFITNPDLMMAPLATPFVRRKGFTNSFLMDRTAAILNSNESFALTQDFHISVKLLKKEQMAGGGQKNGRGLHVFADYEHFLRQKRSVMVLAAPKNDQTNLCFAKATQILLAERRFKLKTLSKKMLAAYKRNGVFLKTRAWMLQRSAKVKIGKKIKIVDIPKFEKVLPADVGFRILDAPNHNLLYETARPYKYRLPLLYYKNHFMPILDLKNFLGYRYRCVFCGKNTQSELYKHVCSQKCFKCHQGKHNTDRDFVRTCESCDVSFNSYACFDDHLHSNIGGHKTVCELYKTCQTCSHVHRVDGECGPLNGRYCGFCAKKVNPDHVCMMVAKKTSKNAIKKELFVWDVESRFSDEFFHPDPGVYLKHVPNMVICRKICTMCLNNFNSNCRKCEIMTFTGDRCIRDFISYILKQKHALVLAHNSARYDHIFVANEICKLAAHRNVQRLPIANSILSLNIDNTIFFRDTFLFFRTALKNLPKTFGFVDLLAKTPFPYFFNVKKNWNYIGPLPPLHYYQPCLTKMTNSEKNTFLGWYHENKNFETFFNFRKELKEYCLNDVNVLAQAVVIFRKLFLSFGMEVFERITLSQAAFHLFRDFFMESGTIQILRERKDNTSLATQKWLHVTEKEHNVTIQKADEPFEYIIPNTNYKVDGYHEKTNTCFEFVGCYFHGSVYCDCYRPDEFVVGGQPASVVADCTKQRFVEIRNLGYNIIIMPECVWAKKVREEGYNFAYMPKTLTTRSALSGGRTEVFKIFFSDQLEPTLKARYLDFNSLYPFVQKTYKYPIGAVEFITGPDVVQDISNYFGIISCQIEAPRDLKIPVLPTRISNKLMFGLCTRCMIEKSEDLCKHRASERDLYGCWVSEEIKLAIQFGYKLKFFFQVYNYKNSSGSVFKNYIDHFLKQKIQAKGYPSNLQSDQEKLDYVQEVEDREGIILNKDQIISNSGLYFISKILLNSLWGKLCQRPNLKKTCTVTTDEALAIYSNNHKIEILDIFAIGYSALLINYEFKDQYTPQIPSQNCILGSFVAAYGRMVLYKALNIIGASNLLYTDTDSCIFTEKNDEISKRLHAEIGIGPHLGMLESELSGADDFIKTCICLAPKTYAYVTNKPNKTGQNAIVKNKGFTINTHDENEVCNVDSFIALFKNKAKTLSSVNPNHFVKNPYNSTVFMKKLTKTMKFEYDKRYLHNSVETLPYGYDGPI